MDRQSRDIRPLLLLIFLNVLGIMAMFLNKNNSVYDLAVLSTIMCSVSIVTYFIITKFSLGDPYLFVIVSVLASVGIVILSRIDTIPRYDEKGIMYYPNFGQKQIIWYLAGVAAFFTVLFMYRRFNKYLKNWVVLYYLVCILLFLATAIFGEERNGAKNWIIIGSLLTVQPSEFARIFYVLALAAIMCKTGDAGLSCFGKKIGLYDMEKMSDKGKSWIRMFAVAAIAGSCAVFLLFQTDLGTLLVFGVVYLAFLYVYGERKRFLALNLIAVVIAAVVACMAFDHVNKRVEAWLDPKGNYENVEVDPESNGKGYQIVQSLVSIGTGEFTGSGIGNGSLKYIFAAESDSIFVVICEELGLLGGIAILMIYFVLVYRGFKIALSTTNSFNKAVSMGLSVVLGIQTFIIVGGITNLIPLTGITLPFISAGGSSMISTFMIVGILQAISSMKGEATDELE